MSMSIHHGMPDSDTSKPEHLITLYQKLESFACRPDFKRQP